MSTCLAQESQDSQDWDQEELDQLRDDLRMEEVEEEVRRGEQEPAKKKVENCRLKQAYVQPSESQAPM